MAEPRWITVNGHHVLLNPDKVSDTGKSDVKKGKVVSGKGAVKDVKGSEDENKTKRELFTNKFNEEIDATLNSEGYKVTPPSAFRRRLDSYDKTVGGFSEEEKAKFNQRIDEYEKEYNKRMGKTNTATIKSPTTDRGLKEPGRTVSLEEKKAYLRENNLTKFAKELNPDGNNTEAAINYVYDQNTLSKEDFNKKYGVSEGVNKTKSAVIKNPGSKKGTVSDEAYTRSQEGGRNEYGTTGKQKSLSKMNTNELRDLAVSLGADKKKLYGTSKQSLIAIINKLRK